MSHVSRQDLLAAVPTGWDSIWLGWELDLDWSELLPALESNVAADGYTMFGLFFMAMFVRRATTAGTLIGAVFAGAGWFLVVQEGQTIFGSIFGGVGALVALGGRNRPRPAGTDHGCAG